jgi:hypothetical protein
MLLAIVFTASSIAAIISTIFSPMQQPKKVVISLAIAVIGVAAYILASTSEISPFSQRQAAFGYFDNAKFIAICVVGVAIGVTASIAWSSQGFKGWSQFWRPLIASPILPIPVLKAIPNSESDILADFILFCLSFQNGFFWEKVLKKND